MLNSSYIVAKGLFRFSKWKETSLCPTLTWPLETQYGPRIMTTLLGEHQSIPMPTEFIEEFVEIDSISIEPESPTLVLSMSPEDWDIDSSIDRYNIGKILITPDGPALIVNGRPTSQASFGINLINGHRSDLSLLDRRFPGTLCWRLVLPSPISGEKPLWSFSSPTNKSKT